MSETMPSESEHAARNDAFRSMEKILERLRATATPPSVAPESWLKRTFNPAPPSTHQSDFNAALVDALTQFLSTLRDTGSSQEARLAQIADELPELQALSENLDAFREHSVRMEGELRSAAANVRGLQERSAALESELAQLRDEAAQLREELAQLRNEQSEKVAQLSNEQRDKLQQLSQEQLDKIEQLTSQQRDLGREIGERIQHLLDEQRVCIRQLSLQASEEAVLADRARRATELKLEELARRVPPPPA